MSPDKIIAKATRQTHPFRGVVVSPISLSLKICRSTLTAIFTRGIRAVYHSRGCSRRHALKIARLEWGISLPSNPVDNIRVPNGIRRRERRLEDGEYQRLKDAAQSCRNHYIWPVVEFALETAMRRSEILSLQWQHTDLDAGLAILLDTKNGSKRKVPLTRRARRVISQLPDYSSIVFDTTDYSIRHGWDRLVKRAGIKNLRFHDLRHEAVSSQAF